MAILLCALGFVILVNLARVRQVDEVSAIGESSGTGPSQATSLPRLVIPDHNNESYAWLDQTRQMFDRNEWRVRHVSYENAPFGHAVSASSPYRWWLGSIAWCHHIVTERSWVAAIEWAARYADPLLHLLLLTATVLFVVYQFGVFSGACAAIGLAMLFPFGSEFLAGMPGDRGLSQILAIWSVLPLLAGATSATATGPDAARHARRWFFAAGVIGGLGIWICAAREIPVLVGVSLGGLASAWISKREGDSPARELMPWRTWALCGAATTLIAYLIEFAPGHLGSWQLQTIHPIYGVAWIGAGELLTCVAKRLQRQESRWSFREIATWVLAAGAVASVPFALWRTHSWGFLTTDPTAFRLSRLPGGESATSFFAWLNHEGASPNVCATLLPVLLIVPAIWQLTRRGREPGSRALIAFALGPVLVALGFACWQLSWWNVLDGALVGLVTAMAATRRRTTEKISPFTRRAGIGLMALLLLPGAIRLVPRLSSLENSLNESDVFGLVERDMARWLAKHTNATEAVVLAPHNQTISLYYYGGLRGLVTLNAENRDGLAVAARIVSASTADEAKALIDGRGVTHIVIPSWDSYLDVYAQMGIGRLDGTFINSLHLWLLPRWLRPVAYQLPTISGFDGQSVTIFEVVDDQDDATALSRTAEYFIEMNRLDAASAVAQALRRFPADLGAWVARAEVETARGDETGLATSLKMLNAQIAAKGDRALAWDRRVGLAVVLARAKQTDLAREQVRRCLSEITGTKLKALSTGSLYRLLVLARAYGFSFENPKVYDLALQLLPDDMRARLTAEQKP